MQKGENNTRFWYFSAHFSLIYLHGDVRRWIEGLIMAVNVDLYFRNHYFSLLESEKYAVLLSGENSFRNDYFFLLENEKYVVLLSGKNYFTFMCYILLMRHSKFLSPQPPPLGS